MSLHVLFYLGLFAACCGYALWRGGAPERLCSATCIAATVLTSLAQGSHILAYRDFQLGVMVVDIATLAAFGVVMLYADRFWPIWITGLQASTVLLHFVKLLNPELGRFGYAIALTVWSYPILVLIAWGAWRHRRRLARIGHDAAWSRHRPIARQGI